ncbi:MAG: class I SAM-dependent methyltransferase [Anaerolineales bacterium]|nr:class I SAM-dependent methyltransferase [Anaerolineales bacterium]MCB8939373.1 class I SAM-dependent methyltransferase [Ardenticatenaceae bacterium]
MNSYDKLYQQGNLFGRPYPQFVAFMRDWEPKGSVLDVGCGQGRDALFLAELGYSVTGIDASQLGISQMLATAKTRNLNLNGIVADFYEYEFQQKYDVIVLDSILHFHKKDLPKEQALLQTLTARLNPGGLICLFLHKSKAKEKQLKNFFAQNHLNWPILAAQHIGYTYEEPDTGFSSTSQFFMFFVQNKQ